MFDNNDKNLEYEIGFRLGCILAMVEYMAIQNARRKEDEEMIEEKEA